MIVEKRLDIISLLLTVRGSIVPYILPQIALTAGFSVLVAFLYQQQFLSFPELNIAPFGLVGVALSLFLGFRNNAAYERWWEGRKLLGSLVHETRAIARASLIFMSDVEVRTRFLKQVVAFSHALRFGLRADNNCEEALSAHLGQDAARLTLTSPNPADKVMRELALITEKEYREGRCDSIAAQTLNQHLNQLGYYQAGLERLASTPLPFAYSLLVHRTTYIYCLLLPFGLVSSLQWFTPFFAALVAYCFFGLDTLSQQLEKPFSKDGFNHLPLEAICRINEISISEALGQVPAAQLAPYRYVLD